MRLRQIMVRCSGHAGDGSVLRLPGLRMVRVSNRAGGFAAAVICVSWLLVSCNAVKTSSTPAIHTDVVADHAPPHIQVSDSFDIADLEKRFETVARHAAPSVVAISATDAKVESDDALRSDRINPEK